MANDDLTHDDDERSSADDLFREPSAPARKTMLRQAPQAPQSSVATLAAGTNALGQPAPVARPLQTHAQTRRGRPLSTETIEAPPRFADPPSTPTTDTKLEVAHDSVPDQATRELAQDSPKLVPEGVDRNLALARIQERMLGVAPRAVEIGRFIVLEKLGQGAMGIVYLAYDPKLDRKAAIKLVDTSALGSEVGDAQVRLEREAKAAAALGHPNVVTVYDVGAHDENVFLAMEFVQGTSLTDWMKQARPWRETVDTFVQIGRGLAAAHEAGLVHRDFKPDNVLMGSDGRPRVADFGLARPTEGWSARDAARVLEDDTRSKASRRTMAIRSADAMASTGEICGTPAYMAPEQFVGANVCAASDQFGFCASLFEALFGYRPFKGQSVTELAVAVIENNREPLPPRHEVSKLVVEAILRGLQPEPQHRHPSMQALTDQLDRALQARTRNAMFGGAAVIAVLGVGLGAQASSTLDEKPCEAAEASVEQTWNEDRDEAVKKALREADLPVDIAGRLGTHASALAEDKRDACEATRIRGEQSDRVLSLRMSCFDRAQQRLNTAATELETSPSASLLEAIPDALADLGTCDDVRHLETLLDKFSRDDALSSQQAALLDDFATLSAKVTLYRSDPPDKWVPLAQQLVDIGETYDIPQAAVEGHLSLGSAALAQARFDEARTEFDAALPWATRGMDDMASLVMVRQSEAALLSGDLVVAQTLAQQAIVFATRARDPMRRNMLHAEATMASVQAQFARERFEPARPVLEALLGDPDLQQDTPGHARLQARMSAMLGQACRHLGDLPCALEQAQRSLTLAQQTQGTDPLNLAGRYANVGLLHADMGDVSAAVGNLQDAARLVETAVGPDHPMRGQLLSDIGGIQGAMGDPKEGLENLEAGLAIHEKVHGPDAPELVEALIDLNKTHLALGNLDAAVEHGRRAVTIVDAAFEGPHPRRADPRVPLSEALIARDAPDEAIITLEQAVEILDRPSTHPMQLADVRFALARALAVADPARAAGVADAALAGIADFEPGAPLREAIQGWRAATLDVTANAQAGEEPDQAP